LRVFTIALRLVAEGGDHLVEPGDDGGVGDAQLLLDILDLASVAKERLDEALRKLKTGKMPAWARRWKNFAWDTVGAVSRDVKGGFAAGCSTGGHAYMMPGRVGDSPLVGAGFYAGPAGAVTVTGVGEQIARVVLSKFVYDRIAKGERAQAACDAGLALFRKNVPVGIIALDRTTAGTASNRAMASWSSARTK